MKRRTKITLTIAGLMALAGIFYAANPSQFSAVPSGAGVVGVAASQSDLLVTEYSTQNLDTIDCFGNVHLLATIPGAAGTSLERYVTIAPSQSANAGFTPRDIFVTQGTQIFRFTPPNGPFTTFGPGIPGCGTDHTGITFDHYGAFGYNMIVTCEGGGVWQVDSTGNPTLIADVSNYVGGLEIEGPAVVPPDFGTYGGQILVADEDNGQIHAIANGATPGTGVVTPNVFGSTLGFFPGAEGVVVIPSTPCTFCTGSSFFRAVVNFDAVYQNPVTDFTSLGGGILITNEMGNGTYVITWDGTNSVYNSAFFDNIDGGSIEGSAWADCDVPKPTATPTSTATATATPTATPTATATPIASPTPCTLQPCTPAYPFVSNNPQTNVAFNESTVLKGFRISTSTDGCTPVSIQAFYSDEHALTLGIRQIAVKSGKNTLSSTNYDVAKLATNPGSATNPAVGATQADGATDTAGRPMFPALFITDLSVPPGSTNELAGDWQFGGTGVPPTAVFGTWKAAVKTTDCSKNPCTVTVTPDADPAKNDSGKNPTCCNLGLGADPVPTGLTTEGYSAEVRWDVNTLGLISGHQYRLYFMVHDGDQNKTGGDVGQACGYFTMP